MKKYRYYLMAAAFTSMLFGTQSCDLSEYNPGGSTADGVFKSQAGFNALVNSAYAYWGGQFYGREDFVLLLNGGTDTWINIANCGYGRQMSKYQEGMSTTGQFRNTWQRLYEIINDCNAGLERINDVEWTDVNMKNIRLGELSFMRAYAYWHLVEMFGEVDMRTTETKEIVMHCYRSSYEDLYDLMLNDIQTAVDNLPVDPYPTTDVGRATSKAAYALKARIALTRVAYCNTQAEKDQYYEIAQTAAQYVIDNQSALKTGLYATPFEVFDPENNKNNKEALFVVTHSTESSLNMQSNNPNRLHIYFHAKYSGWAGMELDYANGNDRNSKSGSMAMMPTRYLLDLYNEEIDNRYNSWFREAYYLNTASAFTWTADQLNHFEKPASMAGQQIQPGELSMLFTKKALDESAKRTLPYAAVDINDTYNADGSVSTNANFNIHFPTLLKYEDKSIADRGLPANSQVGANDVLIMRLPEMYFIVAECEIMKSGGNKSVAKDRINVIRGRAAVPGRESEMDVSEGDMTLDFILEEKAREFCGEFIRWFDLKRTGKLAEYIIAHNPDIVSAAGIDFLNAGYCNLRPIPQTFLDAILNPEEFGQNPGF